MDTLELAGRRFILARARAEDVPELVVLLADDVLGRDRESADLALYEKAFARIDREESHLLLVVRSETGSETGCGTGSARGELVGTMQLTLLPSLSRGGATRLQIEAVRVDASTRGTGLGTAMFTWAQNWGRARGASLAQLTTDAVRLDAHRFYERLGYAPSHVGFKRSL